MVSEGREATPHIPVMLNEVLASLAPRAGGVYVDGTFGAGGYSRGILEQSEAQVIGIDRDPSVRVFAERLAKEFPGRFRFLLGNFSQWRELAADAGEPQVDGVVLDIGVSSMQLDQAERGFSFRADGPLDMRMAQEGVSAADIVNQAGEKELADILYRYGEERQSRRIAKKIVEARAELPIETTSALREIIHSVQWPRMGEIDPATRSFQALRIAVNGELEALESALLAAETGLKPGGRMVVVSFHSLEDRIVKQFMRARDGQARTSRHDPGMLLSQRGPEASFRAITRKAGVASAEEQARNPRARSARLRAMERVSHGGVHA